MQVNIWENFSSATESKLFENGLHSKRPLQKSGLFYFIFFDPTFAVIFQLIKNPLIEISRFEVYIKITVLSLLIGFDKV